MRSRWLKLLGLGAALVLVIVVVLVGPLWIVAVIPRWVWRSVAIGCLDAILIVYAAMLVGGTLGLLIASVILTRTRQVGRRVLLARLLLLCVSGLSGVGLLEDAAAAWSSWTHRSPKLLPLPSTPRQPPEYRLPTESGREVVAKTDGSTLKILVIGESSALGEHFYPWLSVGQILGWQLGKVLGTRRVEVDMQAESGATLEQMHQKLAGLRYRPDLRIQE